MVLKVAHVTSPLCVGDSRVITVKHRDFEILKNFHFSGESCVLVIHRELLSPEKKQKTSMMSGDSG